jgi:hypothetical protein
LKSRPKQAPPPAPAAAPQHEAADTEVIVLDDADKLHQREADSKITATVEYVNLILRPPSPPPAGKGKRTFAEVEKGIALEELRQMRTRAAAVRELKRKNPVKWATLRESHIQYWEQTGVGKQRKNKAGSSRYLPRDVLQSCREAVEGQIKAGVEVNSTLLRALWRGIIVEAGLVSDRMLLISPHRRYQ